MCCLIRLVSRLVCCLFLGMFEVVDLVLAARFLDSEFCQSFADICILRLWKIFLLAALGCVCVSLSLFKRLLALTLDKRCHPQSGLSHKMCVYLVAIHSAVGSNSLEMCM